MVGVVVVAAGSGSRFGTELPKQYNLLTGQPVISWSLKCFLDHPAITSIIVVISAAHQKEYDQVIAGMRAVEGLSRLKTVIGGNTRQASVQAGLLALEGQNVQSVLIHDAARPLLEHALIDKLLERLKSYKAAVPVLPAVDSTKYLNIDDQTLGTTLPRDKICRVRTPQAFDFSTILELHKQAEVSEAPDDAELILHAGLKIATVPCSESLLKVTTKQDLDILESFVTNKKIEFEYRSGTGFDVHAFDDDSTKPLVLCGINVPGSRPLKGHSDADVALHTITDALLGAIAAGDIGTHFPPSDDQWKAVDSAVFLKHAVSLVEKKQGRIVSIDLVIICEEPKFTPHRLKMRERVAEIIGIDVDRVSVKGTTTERLGFTGRKEGIAAQAVASVAIPIQSTGHFE